MSSGPFGAQLKVVEDVPAAVRAGLKKGWTQANLARQVGMQQPTIARLEGGNYDRVSLPTVKKVARALGAEIKINSPRKRSRAAAGKIVLWLPRLCRPALSVHKLPHVAGQIVLIALAPRQRIDARRQPVHVVIGVCGRIAPRVGDVKQVALRIVSKPRGPVQRIEHLGQPVQPVVSMDCRVAETI